PTASRLIDLKWVRMSTREVLIAAAYSSGGRKPSSTSSGVSSIVGTNGRHDPAVPTGTRTSDARRPKRWHRAATVRTVAATARTMIAISMTAIVLPATGAPPDDADRSAQVVEQHLHTDRDEDESAHHLGRGAEPTPHGPPQGQSEGRDQGRH